MSALPRSGPPGKINPSGWVAINALPTAARTIWGVLAGKLLMSERPGSATRTVPIDPFEVGGHRPHSI